MEKPFTALYIRLSVDDGNEGESNSVKNQRDLLNNFVSNHKELSQSNLVYFIDDGHSGTNFNRPAVKQMIEQIKKGEIKTVIVKDLSRFGRNYLEVGDYLEQIFPFLGVRFISVNDSYDSTKNNGITAGIDIGLKNLINDMYSRDLSVKVMTGKMSKARKGEHIAAYTPLGYVKSKEKKNTLVVDEETAKIVRYIFELALNGNTTTQIARILNSENIPTPAACYRQRNNNKLYKRFAEGKWNLQAVLKILTDLRYLGKTVNFQRQRIDVGSKQTRKVAPENWIVVDDTHEPIISEELYNQAQSVLTKKKEYVFKNSNRDRPLFGKLKCGVCKKAMYLSNGRVKFYKCRSTAYDNESKCFSGRIAESDLEQTLLISIITQAQIANDIEHKVSKSKKHTETELSSIIQEILKTEQHIGRIDTLLSEAYDSYLESRNTKEEYFKEKSELNAQSQKLSEHLHKLKSNYEIALLKRQEFTNQFVEQFKQYQNIDSLSPALVNNLVEVIYIYDDSHIEIVWKYLDDFQKIKHLLS